MNSYFICQIAWSLWSLSTQVTWKPQSTFRCTTPCSICNQPTNMSWVGHKYIIPYNTNTMLGRPQIHQEHNKYIPGPPTTTATATYQSRSPNAPFCRENAEWGFEVHLPAAQWKPLKSLYFLLSPQPLATSSLTSENKDRWWKALLPVLQIRQYGFYWLGAQSVSWNVVGGGGGWGSRAHAPGTFTQFYELDLGWFSARNILFCSIITLAIHRPVFST